MVRMRLHDWIAILYVTASLSAGADSLEFSTTIFMSVMLEQEFPRELGSNESEELVFSSQESCSTNLFYAETEQLDGQSLPANLCDLTSPEAVGSLPDAAGPIIITIARH